ncbi:type VI secretion system membrane subunit TssM [Buttiauxella agrestis]|uniref:type VI secretion system membrane subunit TssM n=1 Tax=Buttiauxella agrestis TaxID=82977 RepID=UPI003976C44B
MFYLNRLFSGRPLKTLMLVTWFILFAIGIWYLGPFLGFGKIRPLEAVSARIVFILLALFWFARFWWRIPFFIIIAVTVSVIAWELGPYFLTGQVYPLAPVLNRLIVIAVIVLLTGLYAAWKLLLALAVNPDLLQNLLRFHKTKPDTENDVSEVAAIIRNAASWAQKTHGGMPKLRRVFLPGYRTPALPWYLVVGSDNAGKTSLISASGQDFPLPEQLHRLGTKPVPTKNCECWFANDALFIDTAGKYVTDASIWKPEWLGLLNAIGKYRPVKAVNGAIVAISVADILAGSKAERLNFAVALRSRLSEIRTQLGLRFPVYVVLTKLDRLAGFEEYFRNLSAEGREQIWGVTLPYGGKSKISESGLQDRINEELRLLEERIENNMNLRQQEEYSVADRKKMYGLPQDFRRLSEGLAEVVQNIFFASRYDETQFYSALRGIYFASSHQPGDPALQNKTTLIQRWHHVVSGGAATSQAAPESDATGGLISTATSGRHYFLKKLFSEIIVKDAGLVRHNHNTELRYRLRNLVGHCACVVAVIWLLNGFLTSYQNNTQYLDSVAKNMQTLEKHTTEFIRTTEEDLLPGLLNLSQTLPEFGALDVSSPELRYRYGLYIGDKIAYGAGSLYQFFQQKYLLPLIEHQAAKALQDALSADDNARIYDALKLYLMISSDSHFEQSYVVESITTEWENAGKIAPYGDSTAFAAHLDTLFSQPDWRRNVSAPDPELIRQARQRLGRQSATARVYDRMKSRLQAEAPENMTLGRMTSSDAPQLFTLTDQDLRDNGVPGLFTYAGYHDVVKKKVLYLVNTLRAEDNWVMAKLAGDVSDPLKMKTAVMALYLKEYRTVWSRFLAGLRLVSTEHSARNIPDFTGDIYMLRTLASDMSPLLTLAKESVRQTTLSVPETSVLMNATLRQNNRALSNAKKLNNALELEERKQVAEAVDKPFAALRTFVTGSGSVAPKNSDSLSMPGTTLAKVLGTLMDQYTLLVISSSAMNQGNVAGSSDSGKTLAAQAQTWPDPFKNIITPLLMGVYEKVDRQTVVSTQKAIDSGPGEICRNTLEGRYPFADSKHEASLSDIEHFFAKGGVADDYFEHHLADKVDTTSSPWRYKGGADTAGLEMFEQAAAIRNAFFQDDAGKKISLHLSLSVPYMSPTITQLALRVEGNDLKYAHGPVTPVAFNWPGNRTGVMLSAMPRADEADEDLRSDSLRSPELFNGSWSLFHWLDRAQQTRDAHDDTQVFTFFLDKQRVDVGISGLRHEDISDIELLRQFSCPEVVVGGIV